ncbi:hypothetical protein PAXINDRAFT_21628 [Paxillus involutus ATCC 200175]|uniref:Uncharacterized protein n=1 Tax=Paxillus involutus ATCC 200175 TaxID=664439 RepID=A0A0C9TCW7_PAXIN|nr:hypothetical protein PAXINDRAFT_21628 [Paxillus involutus ATCC 200175]
MEASQGAVPSLNALQRRLERSQSAPLFLDIVVGEQSDRDALRVLFAESSRFCHLTLSVLDLSWRDDISTQGFTQLSKLTVHTGFQALPHVDALSAIFSSAPRLRSVKWHSIDAPGLVAVNGHQLHFVDLTVFHLPVTRLLEILEACPNLRSIVITFQGEQEYTPIPPRERILLPELRSLVLDGTGHIACIMRSIQTPLLSRIDIKWWHYNGHQCALEALQSLLAYSPNLEEIALRRFLETEDGLMSIITNNNNLVRLTVAAETYRRVLITHKTFDFLTHQGQENYTLPQLESLVFWNALDVPDEVVLRMIKSRVSLPNDTEPSSRACRARTLKSFRMDGCKPMAVEAISRLEAMCRDSRLKAEGAFVNRN